MGRLRILLLAMLMIAMMPWGAYLGRGIAPAVALADSGQTVMAQTTQQTSVGKITPVCRKALPGFRCALDPATLPQTATTDTPPLAAPDRTVAQMAIPSGQSLRPNLPPPRRA